MEFPVARWVAERTVRLVATGRLRDPVLALLVEDPALISRPREALDALARDLAEIEGATSARLNAQQTLASLLGTGRPHANFVNAAFAYFRPRALNRFNGPGLGAWYAAIAVETSLAEVAFHIGRELAHVGEFRTVVEWAELWASFAGEFVDLRGVSPPPNCLDPDPARGYPAGNALAQEARGQGLNGIIYPSVRHSGGSCVVALWPHAVQSVAQGAVWRMSWNGSATPHCERL